MGVAVSDYYSHFVSLTLFNVAQYGPGRVWMLTVSLFSLCHRGTGCADR